MVRRQQRKRCTKNVKSCLGSNGLQNGGNFSHSEIRTTPEQVMLIKLRCLRRIMREIFKVRWNFFRHVLDGLRPLVELERTLCNQWTHRRFYRPWLKWDRSYWQVRHLWKSSLQAKVCQRPCHDWNGLKGSDDDFRCFHSVEKREVYSHFTKNFVKT